MFRPSNMIMAALAAVPALFALVSPPAAAAHPWPMYHRDAQRGGQSPVNGPRYFEVKWIADLGSGVKVNYASPVVDENGRTYIGTSDGKVHCIGGDGQPAGGSWPYDTGATASEFDQTPSTPSAAVAADGSVYILDVIGRLHKVSSDGAFVWRYDTPANAADSHPLILPNGSVAIATYLFLSQFNANAYLHVIKQDGSLDWSSTRTGLAHVLASPSLDQSGSMYATTFNNLWQYSLAGAEGFSYNNGRNHMYCTPAFDPATGSMMLTDFGGSVIAINPAGLPPVYKKNVFANVSQASLAVGSTGYAVGTAYGSSAAGIQTSDGSVLWKMRLNGLARSAASLDAGEVAYLGVEGGRIYSISRNGAARFIVDIGTDASSTPAFNGSGDLLIGFDTECGARLLCLSSDPVAYTKSIGYVKTSQNGQFHEISPKPVICKGSGFFYVQDWDGCAGIRVVSNAAVVPGDVVRMVAALGSDPVTGERQLYPEAVLKISTCVDQGVHVLRSGAIGGQTQGANGGITGGAGIPNAGVLVQTSGRVSNISATAAGATFTVNDGSAAAPSAGIRVHAEAPPLGSHVTVTGVITLEAGPGKTVVAALLTRSASDVVVEQ